MTTMRFNLQLSAWMVLLLTVRLAAQPFPPPVSGGLVDIEATVNGETSSVQHDYQPPKSATILAETLHRTRAPKTTVTATETPAAAGELTATFNFDPNYAAGHPDVIRPMGEWSFDWDDWFYYSSYQFSKVTKKTIWSAEGEVTFWLQAKRLKDGATDIIEGTGQGAAIMAVGAPSFWPTKFDGRDITSFSGNIGRFQWVFYTATEWRYLHGIQGYFYVPQADGTNAVFHLNHFTGPFEGPRVYYPIGELTAAGTPGHGKGVSYQTTTEPLTEAEAYNALKQETWSFTDNFEPTPGASAHYAFSSGTASASKLRYKIVIQPGLARTVTWSETFTPEGASEPSDIRILTENVTATATETQVHTIDPFARFGSRAGTYQVQAFEAESFEAGLTVDANRDGQILPAAGPMTEYVIAHADTTSTDKPYGFLINADDDDGDGAADHADLQVNGPEDLADFFPVFLNIKQLLTTLPAGTKCILRQADGALNFVYTDLKQAKAFTYLDNPETGFGPNFDQPAATATAQQITSEGVELSEEFVNRIRYQNQGVILVEFRAPTQQPLTLTIETGTGVFVITLPLQTSLAELAVDANRDGEIKTDGSDATSIAQPYRFWLNDDDDGNALNNETEVEGSSSTDYSWRGDFGIASKRDLEDFARLWINSAGIADALKSGDLQIGLRWKADTVTESPAINLYRHYEANGGTGYLTDNATAIQQTTPPYSTTLVDAGNKNVVSSTNGVFIFKKEVFANLSSSQTKTYLLFEGAGVGKGMLQLLLLDKNGNQIGEGAGVWLDIRRVNTMFERVKATTQYALSSDGIDATMPLPHDYIDPEQVPQPTMGWTADDRGEAFVPDPNEDLQNKNYIVFVHGWRQAPGQGLVGVSSALTYARTMYKRLWHAGYKGRFVAFRWPTFYGGSEAGDDDPLRGFTTYNDSEYRAWKAGQSLAQYVNQLPNEYKRRITAHSMGNIVAGSAFKYGMVTDSYALLNAAVPALCYEETALRRWPTFTGIYGWLTSQAGYSIPSQSPNAPDSRTPVDDADFSIRERSYIRQLETMNANVVNFYLEADFATSISWNANNVIMRPHTVFDSRQYGYIFDHADPGERIRLYDLPGLFTSLTHRHPSDPHEVMAYDCKVPTFTVNATGATRGSIIKAIDMNAYGFNREHSAQWQWRFQQTAQFYQRLLSEFGLTPTL